MFTHSVSRRQVLTRAAVAVPIGTASLLVPTAAYADDGRSSAQRVVTKYFGILNAGMASADGDFSALATVYHRDAVLTQSNPAGVTNVYHGLDAIMGFYVALWRAFQGIQWSQDNIRNVTEHVGTQLREHAGETDLDGTRTVRSLVQGARPPHRHAGLGHLLRRHPCIDRMECRASAGHHSPSDSWRVGGGVKAGRPALTPPPLREGPPRSDDASATGFVGVSARIR
jgi:hypothetical protein